MEKILILGGGGFLGSHILKKLNHKNYEIHIVGRQPHSKIQSNQQYIYHEIDICDLNALKNIPKDLVYVINASGDIDHSKFLQGGCNIFDSHFLGTKNIISHLDWTALKKFVQIGSSDEYGNSSKFPHESLVPKPFSPYSLAKTFSTSLVQLLAETENFPGIIIRPFLFYGPGQKLNRFLPFIISSCLNDKKFPISPGNQTRDFCHVDDIASGVILAMKSSRGNGEVINLGSGVGITIKEMVTKVQEIIGYGKPDFGGISYRDGENMHLVADINKAISILNWKPKILIDKGLADTINFYKNE
jgi:nucleoside-diphosphate-sugar epimerase